MKKVKLGKVLQFVSIAVLTFALIAEEELPGVIPEPALSIAKYAAIAVLAASFFVDI